MAQQSTKELQLIGKGLFTKCYALNKKQVLLVSKDYTKECIADGYFPSSRLFPKIERSDVSYQYIARRYHKVKAPKQQLTKDDYELYKELRKIYKYSFLMNDVENLTKIFKHLSNKRASKALCSAIEGLRNYGDDISFEISPRNIAISDSGRLILLDCFLFRSQCREAFKGTL